MDTAGAIITIRKALRRKGTTATLSTRLGYMPTTKAAVSGLMPKLGEVTYTSSSGDTWTFSRDGDDFDTTVAVHEDSVLVVAGS